MNALVPMVWILAANLLAAIIYPKVSNLSGAALYWVAGNLIISGWIYGALTKAPLSILGVALGATFPLLCLAVGW